MQKVKMTAILLSLLFIIGNFLAARDTQEAELEDISFQKVNQKIEVFIKFPSGISYESFSLMNPNRLVLDFFGIRTVTSPALIEINDLGILSIRSALNRPGVARVVFSFTDDMPHYRIEDTETGLTVIFSKEGKIEEIVTKEEKAPQEEIKKEVKPEEKEPPEVQLREKIRSEREKKPAPSQMAIDEHLVKKMSVGVSSGYRAIQDRIFREAYGEGGVFFKGEFTFLLPIDIESFDIWASFDYFKKTGKTTITEEDLKLRITTFSLAMRYLKKLSKFTPFAGAGIDYITYKEILPEEFIVASVSGSDIGFHVQGGAYFDVLPSLSLKAHLRYIWSKTTEDDVAVNLGGVEYGLGIVYRFNL
jgi:opacity protein-like surface antigen